MADKKFTQLPAAAGMTSDDLLAICNDPGGAPVSQKLTGTQLIAFLNASAAQVYTGAAPPAAPADATRAAIFYPTGGGILQQWDVAGAAWV